MREAEQWRESHSKNLDSLTLSFGDMDALEDVGLPSWLGIKHNIDYKHGAVTKDVSGFVYDIGMRRTQEVNRSLSLSVTIPRLRVAVLNVEQDSPLTASGVESKSKSPHAFTRKRIVRSPPFVSHMRRLSEESIDVEISSPPPLPFGKRENEKTSHEDLAALKWKTAIMSEHQQAATLSLRSFYERESRFRTLSNNLLLSPRALRSFGPRIGTSRQRRQTTLHALQKEFAPASCLTREKKDALCSVLVTQRPSGLLFGSSATSRKSMPLEVLLVLCFLMIICSMYSMSLSKCYEGSRLYTLNLCP